MLSQNTNEVAKQELKTHEEKTIPGKFYVPKADIVETVDSLEVTLDVPGVDKENLIINLEKNILEIESKIKTDLYSELKPLYSEYNVGHFSRKFSISNNIDQEKIEASITDGVLKLVLPKVPEAQPRQITVH